MSDNLFPLTLSLWKQAGPMSVSEDGKRQLYRDPVTGAKYTLEKFEIKVTYPESIDQAAIEEKLTVQQVAQLNSHLEAIRSLLGPTYRLEIHGPQRTA